MSVPQYSQPEMAANFDPIPIEFEFLATWSARRFRADSARVPLRFVNGAWAARTITTYGPLITKAGLSESVRGDRSWGDWRGDVPAEPQPLIDAALAGAPRVEWSQS